jgi:3-polyprenyl-4-hydroxybenzoate decarboxylase
VGYYPSLREYVQTLESRQKLFRIQREVCRETSSTHLVHWQFRGLPESERRAFLFEKVAGVSRKGNAGKRLRLHYLARAQR